MPTTTEPTGEHRTPPHPALVAFGRLVRERRNDEKVFVLAARAGVTPSSVYKIEAGQGGHLLTAVKLAQALGIEAIPAT